MGPAPKKPPRLYGAPVAGVENSQFPTIGTTEPKGDYRSQINDYRSGNPIDAARTKVIASVALPFSLPAGLSMSYFPGASGDKSRAAFAQATGNMSGNALRRATDEYNVGYKTQAQQAVAQDINAQRQNTFDRWTMDVMKLIFDEDTIKRFESAINDTSAYYEREKKNSQAMVTAAMLRMVGGLLGGLL